MLVLYLQILGLHSIIAKEEYKMKKVIASTKIFMAVCYSMVVFFIGLLLCLLRPFHKDNIYLISKLLAKYGFRILGIEFEHRKQVKSEKAHSSAVYMSNHQNNIDLFVGASSVHAGTILLGKKSLAFIPIFGQFFALSGSLLIDRKNSQAAKKSMNKLAQKMRNDSISVWIMPEGTRSKGRGLLPFKRGGFITAINLQIPIIPVVFSSYAKKLHFSNKKSGKIIAKELAPIQTQGMTLDDVDQLMQTTFNLFQETLIQLDQELSLNKG